MWLEPHLGKCEKAPGWTFEKANPELTGGNVPRSTAACAKALRYKEQGAFGKQLAILYFLSVELKDEKAW